MGADVFWDFVEVPSQFLENFSYEPSILKELGADKDKNPIPDELITKLIKRKKYFQSTYIMGQLTYGMLDLMLHSG